MKTFRRLELQPHCRYPSAWIIKRWQFSLRWTVVLNLWQGLPELKVNIFYHRRVLIIFSYREKLIFHCQWQFWTFTMFMQSFAIKSRRVKPSPVEVNRTFFTTDIEIMVRVTRLVESAKSCFSTHNARMFLISFRWTRYGGKTEKPPRAAIKSLIGKCSVEIGLVNHNWSWCHLSACEGWKLRSSTSVHVGSQLTALSWITSSYNLHQIERQWTLFDDVQTIVQFEWNLFDSWMVSALTCAA